MGKLLRSYFVNRNSNKHVHLHLFLSDLCSDPTYNPIDGFLPVENGRIPFITMSNDGLSNGINPRQRTINFWNYIKQKAFQLSRDEQQNKPICSY